MGTSMCLPAKPDDPPPAVATANADRSMPSEAAAGRNSDGSRAAPKRAESKLKVITPELEARARNALYAAFSGDALGLGVHWEYNAETIKEKYGTPDKFITPGELNQYHVGKEAGDLTHVGDQTILLLEHVASRKRFNASAFITEWSVWFASYAGYKDHACKATYENLNSGRGPVEAVASDSNDLSAASRIAPLLYLFADKSELVKLIQASRAQAGLTHAGSLAAPAAEFFARVAHAVLHGAVPSAAMRTAVEAIGEAALQEKVEQGLAAAANAALTSDEEAVTSLGPVKEFAPGKKVAVAKACNADYAIPATVYFIVKYENAPDALKAALVANTAVGGDNAARGMLIGLVLGARQGPAAAVPTEWVSGLRSKPRIDKALALATSGLTTTPIAGATPPGSPAGGEAAAAAK
eukprot:tig00000254_g22581.t1